MSQAHTTLLTPVEARILGVLIEKQLATPDYYPMTLNALVAGCNQKTSRVPVMTLSDGEAQSAVDDLRHRTLIVDSYGASGRVIRYGHNFGRVLQIPQSAVAALAVLMLRGPQTAAELRINSERLHRFADVSALEALLEDLAQRSAGALVVKLPRQPGAREQRWAHLLCGEPDVASLASPAPAGGDAALRAEVAELRRLVEHLYQELGVTPPATE